MTNLPSTLTGAATAAFAHKVTQEGMDIAKQNLKITRRKNLSLLFMWGLGLQIPIAILTGLPLQGSALTK